MLPACAPLVALLIVFPPGPPLDAAPAYKQPTPIVREADTTTRGVMSREQVAALLAAACDEHGIGDDRAALIQAGLRISWRESRWNPAARNGQHLGLFQFGSGWGTEAQRLDPAWSCRRFVKVYAQTGWRGIKRHWRATF